MMNTKSKLNIQFLMFLFFMLYHLMPSAKKYGMGFLAGGGKFLASRDIFGFCCKPYKRRDSGPSSCEGD